MGVRDIGLTEGSIIDIKIMPADFLSTLLVRGQRGELQPGQFKENLGAHVAELAEKIQNVETSYASVIAKIGIDPKLARPGDEHTARAIVDTFCELAVRPLTEERNFCTDRLIIDTAFEVNREDPTLAAALFSVVG